MGGIPVSHIPISWFHILQAGFHARLGNASGPDEIAHVSLKLLQVCAQQESAKICSFVFPIHLYPRQKAAVCTDNHESDNSTV